MSSNKPIKFELNDIKKAVIRKFPLVTDAFTNVNFREAPINTAATDGKDILYNPAFMDTLSYEEQIFTIAHEALHIAFDHIKRSKEIEAKHKSKNHRYLWNIATDAVINQALKAEGLPIKQGFVDMKDALNQQADIIYQQLLQEYQNQQKNNQQGKNSSSMSGTGNQQSTSGNESSSGQSDTESEQENDQKSESIEDWAKQFGDTFDDHEFWDNESQSENNDTTNNNSSSSRSKKEDNTEEQEQTNDNSGEELEKNFSKKNKEKKQEITNQVMDKIKEQKDKAKEYGNSSGESSKKYGDVGRGKSLYNWKRILNREFNDYIRQWSSRRATYENDYQSRIVSNYMYDKPRTEIILDTSGSIDDDLLKGFIRQLKPMLIDSHLFVGCFDTKFYGFTEIKSNKDIDNFRVVGRGGTDLDITVRSFSSDDKINKVIFTDGDGAMPKKDLEKTKKLFWVVFNNDSFYPCCGTVLYADADEIRREYLKLTKDNQEM